jgi:hypothetical protein
MKYDRFFLLLILIPLLVSCAGHNFFMDDTGRLAQRAKARWAYVIEKNWQKAYEFETKGYRESHTLTQYKASFGTAVTWLNADVHKLEVDKVEGTATATIRLAIKVIIPGMGEQNTVSTFKEYWLKEDGKWWYFKKKNH